LKALKKLSDVHVIPTMMTNALPIWLNCFPSQKGLANGIPTSGAVVHLNGLIIEASESLNFIKYAYTMLKDEELSKYHKLITCMKPKE